MKQTRFYLCAALSAVLAACSAASAQEVDPAIFELPREEAGVEIDYALMPQTAEEMAEKSDAIVCGRVKQVDTTSENSMIVTWVTFEVEDVLKGDLEPGETIQMMTGDGILRKSEIRKGYTGALKELADSVEKKAENQEAASENADQQEDSWIVQTMPYGSLFREGTREVICLRVHGDEESPEYHVAHGEFSRLIEVEPGQFIDLSQMNSAMKNLGFDSLEAVDPALIPENFSEEVTDKMTLEQIQEQYGL